MSGNTHRQCQVLYPGIWRNPCIVSFQYACLPLARLGARLREGAGSEAASVGASEVSGMGPASVGGAAF